MNFVVRESENDEDFRINPDRFRNHSRMFSPGKSGIFLLQRCALFFLTSHSLLWISKKKVNNDCPQDNISTRSEDYNHYRTYKETHRLYNTIASFTMSSMNFSTSKQYVRPPQRGIFPLDHDSECKPFIDNYLACLNGANDVHHKCKKLSKDYLQCRMDRKLMSEENLDDVSGRSLVELRSPSWIMDGSSSLLYSCSALICSPIPSFSLFAFLIPIFRSTIRCRWVTPKKKKWSEPKNTTRQKRRRVLLRGNTSRNNPGGGSNLIKANGRGRITKGRRKSNTQPRNERRGLWRYRYRKKYIDNLNRQNLYPAIDSLESFDNESCPVFQMEYIVINISLKSTQSKRPGG